MKIMIDKQSRFWVMSSESSRALQGHRSPWDDPAIIRQRSTVNVMARAADSASESRQSVKQRPTNERRRR